MPYTVLLVLPWMISSVRFCQVHTVCYTVLEIVTLRVRGRRRNRCFKSLNRLQQFILNTFDFPIHLMKQLLYDYTHPLLEFRGIQRSRRVRVSRRHFGKGRKGTWKKGLGVDIRLSLYRWLLY